MFKVFGLCVSDTTDPKFLRELFALHQKTTGSAIIELQQDTFKTCPPGAQSVVTETAKV
jgi:hypothetical protein